MTDDSQTVTVTDAPEGQVALPETIRVRHRWPSGVRLVAEDHPDGLLLRPEPRAALFGRPTTIDEVAGCLKYDGPPISVEEMDEGIAELFRSEWGRQFDPG